MPYLTLNDGTRYHYGDRGSGRPVVFLHGWGLSGSQFEPQAAALAERYRVITLDLRGHGRSDKPAHGYTVAGLIDDVTEILSALGLDDVALVGTSLGGSVALELACRGAPGVTSVVSVAAPAPRFAWAPDFPTGTAPELLDGLLSSLAEDREQVLGAMCGSWVGADSGELRDRLIALAAQHTPDIDGLFRDVAGQDLRAALPELRIPVAFFHGRNDSTVPVERAYQSHHLVPGSRVVIFSQSHHLPNLEEQDQFTAELDAFLSAAVPAGRGYGL